MNRQRLGRWVASAMVVIVGCGRNSGDKRPSDAAGTTEAPAIEIPGVLLVPETAGATRLLVSENGRFVAAELGGEWIEDAFPHPVDPGEVPPVLKVIDLDARKVVATVNGWAIGGPAEDGAQLYLSEVGEEYAYQIRSTTNAGLAIDLEPPAAGWIPRATLAPSGGISVVVLRAPGKGRSDRLWFAAIDPTQGRVVNSTTIDSPSPFAEGRTFDVAVAANPRASMIYIGENAHPSDPWALHAFSVPDLEKVWSVQLAGHPNDALSAVVFGVGGSGDRVFVGQGHGSHAFPNLRTVRVLAADTGVVLATAEATELGLRTSTAISVVPVKARNEVAILYRLRYRTGGGESPDQHVNAVWKVDLGSTTAARVFEVTADLGKQYEAWHSMNTAAIATLSEGGILLAPPDAAWVNKWLGGSMADGEGVERGEIRGLVENPDWHRPGRPRFDARQSALQGVEDRDVDKADGAR